MFEKTESISMLYTVFAPLIAALDDQNIYSTFLLLKKLDRLKMKQEMLCSSVILEIELHGLDIFFSCDFSIYGALSFDFSNIIAKFNTFPTYISQFRFQPTISLEF